MNNKKALGPVIATALLIVVAVITLVLFNAWFQTYSSNLMADVETQSSINAIPEIEGVIGDFVYIKTPSNLTIDRLLVDGDECETNISLGSGMQGVNISSCLNGLSTSTPKITLITDKNIVTQSVYLKDVVIGSGSTSGICDDLPGDWVEVPGNLTLGTNDFCVMKYEAKAFDNSTYDYILDGGNSLTDNWANLNNIEAHSVADARPWVRINQTNARQACENLNNGGADNYHLITNAQWTTIARNVAVQENNWANGIIGSNYSSGGGLYVGNVGDIESTFQSHSCNHGSSLDGSTAGTNCLVSGGGFHDGRNKRTLILSNGEEIWDLSGNVFQWNNDTLNMHTWDEGGSSGYWNTISNETFRFNAGPLNSSWGQFHGVGYVWHSTTQTNGFLRGGFWHNGANAGTFALYLGAVPSTSFLFDSIGFRCSYTP